MINTIITKILSKYYRLKNVVIKNRIEQRKYKHAKAIFKDFRKIDSNVILGTVLSTLGGLPHHIFAIAKHSTHKPKIFPQPDKLENIKNQGSYNNLKYYAEKTGFNCKIMHSHVDPWFINVCNKSKQNGTNWIHTYHTLYFEKDWDNGLQHWQKEINNSLINVASKADVCISISHWLKNLLKEKYNIGTTYIPNGVDITKCDRADATRFIKKYKLKDFVLFASGISDIKNPGDFIKLAHAMPETRFVIIGRQISIKALTEKYNTTIPNNLTVIGQMPHEELLDAIAACKVFVVTSRSEGLPTVLMEAMALERTVVGCDTFGTKEVIGDERYGYIYDHTSLEDLVAKTKLALTATKGKQARKRILENYDWRVVIPQIDAVYSKLL